LFDQPDLKAPFQLEVSAPKEWLVISNQPETSKKVEESGNLAWVYPPTLPLSTYLYTIIAGPWKEIICPPEKLHRGISQSIFCRHTLFQYAEKQQNEIFELNSEGIKRYEELFGYDYPF